MSHQILQQLVHFIERFCGERETVAGGDFFAMVVREFGKRPSDFTGFGRREDDVIRVHGFYLHFDGVGGFGNGG